MRCSLNKYNILRFRRKADLKSDKKLKLFKKCYNKSFYMDKIYLENLKSV